MAYPTLHASSQDQGIAQPGDGAALEWPTHLTGDLGIMAIVTARTPSGSINTVTVPGDWDLVTSTTLDVGGTMTVDFLCYTKVAESAAEADVNLTGPAGMEVLQSRIWTFRGYDPDTIIDSFADISYNGTGAFSIQTPETTLDECLMFFIVPACFAGGSPTPIVSFPESSDPTLDNFVLVNQESVSDIPDVNLIAITAEETVAGSESEVVVDSTSFEPVLGVVLAIPGISDPPEPEEPNVLIFDPEQEGYQNNFSDQLIEIELSGGLSRRRQDSYFAGHIVTVQWLLTREEYAQFMGFFKTDLRHGVDPFLIDLITDIGVPTTHRARTLGGLPRLTRQTGNAYYVSCTLQCERNPTYTGNIIYQEDGDIVFAVDNPTFAECFAAGDTLRIIDSAGIHPTGSTPINLDGEYTVLSTTGFNVVTLDNPASVNSDWTVLAGLGSGIEYGDEDNGNVISTITRVPT